MSTIDRDAFDEYVKLRFENRKASLEQLVADKKNFYRSRISKLLDALGFEVSDDPARTLKERETDFLRVLDEAGIQIITVRTAFDKGSKLLKPVATFPDDRLQYAENIANGQKPKPFKSAEDALKFSEPGPVTEEGTRFSGIYKLGNIPRDTPPHIKGPTIAARIEQAIENARKESDAFNDDPVCFFSVATSYTKRGHQQIDKIIAIYWKHSSGQNVPPENALERAHELCTVLFDEIQQIQMIDNQLFQLEGHELVSSLQPTFLNPDVAPADKIAFAITKLKSLLQKHLDSHYPSSEKNRVNPDVYFVSVSYEAISDKKNDYVYKPLFQIYPHVFRTDYALPAYYISRLNHISVTKLLLKKYFEWSAKNIKRGRRAHEFVLGPSALLGISPKLANIDGEFLDELFAEFDREYKSLRSKRGFTIDFDNTNGDQIFVSKASDAPKETTELYSRLNVAVKGREEENSSIIAYVIEGRVLEKHNVDKEGKPTDSEKYRQLPRALLAIEGQREELFSRAERECLRVVAVAFSNLVRHCFHDNSLLDYRGQLSEAYSRFFSVAKAEDQPRLSRFLLSSIAVDVQLLINIKKRLTELSAELPNNLENVFDEVFKGTEIPDDEASPRLVNSRLRERFERALRFAEKAAETNHGPKYSISQGLVDFIEACPRNFAWAGYAPSLAEALGDRAEHNPPTFRLMTPGFSASGLYMAVVRSQIRQVAKLSSLEKLDKEHRNYRSYVRYKLVLAARMANNAIAFDSRGIAGQKQGKKRNDTFLPEADYRKYCYGVLVSDLASSRKLGAKIDRVVDSQVSTLQDLAWNAVIGVKSAGEDVLFRNIKRAIEQLFGHNLGHWFMLDEAKELKDGAWQGLARAFRLDYEFRIDSGSGIKRVSEAQSEFLIAENFEKLLREDSPLRIFTSIFHKDDRYDDNPPDVEKKRREEVTADERIIATNAKDAVVKSNSLFQLSKIGLHGAPPLPEPDSLAKEFGSIVHGDLNARNLVWAGPIEHLVMIDFEHTTVGLMGADQARLAVNLVVDHMAPYSARANAIDRTHHADQLEAQIKSVRRAAEFVVGFITNHGSTYVATVAPKTKKKSEQENTTVLADIVAAVLSSVKEFFGERDPDDTGHISVLIHALAMALLKEYEYAVKNIELAGLDPSQVRFFLEAKKQTKGSLEEWLTKLFASEVFPASSRGNEQLTSVARYAITFWMLDKIIKQVKIEE